MVLAALLGVANLLAQSDAQAGDGLLPVSLSAAADQSTLREVVLNERDYEHPDFPGVKARIVRVRYFSHEWKDGPWFGELRVCLPPTIKPEHRGMMAMCPAASSNTRPGLDFLRDYLVGTALHFGIPVATIPQGGEHFGKREIHQLSDHLTGRFLDTADPSWLAVYPFAALHMRAHTLVGKIAGAPTMRVVQMGSSITAHQAWKAAYYDRRIVGLVCVGDMGLYLKTRTASVDRLRKISASRPVFVRIADAPSEYRDILVEHLDKALYGKKVRASLLMAVGSNDYAVSPDYLPEFLDGFPMDRHLTLSPNYPHGCGSAVHLSSFRMWIDHCLLDRPLTKVVAMKFNWSDRNTLRISAKVEGEPEVSSVKAYFVQTSEPSFRASKFSADAVRQNYTKAKWQEIEMSAAGGRFSADLALVADGGAYVAFWVQASDTASRTPGHAASHPQWAKRPSKLP